MLKSADQDNDGQISKEEWLRLIRGEHGEYVLILIILSYGTSLLSYLLSSGALESPGLLLSYPTICNITTHIILISTFATTTNNNITDTRTTTCRTTSKRSPLTSSTGRSWLLDMKSNQMVQMVQLVQY